MLDNTTQVQKMKIILRINLYFYLPPFTLQVLLKCNLFIPMCANDLFCNQTYHDFLILSIPLVDACPQQITINKVFHKTVQKLQKVGKCNYICSISEIAVTYLKKKSLNRLKQCKAVGQLWGGRVDIRVSHFF